MTQRRCQGDEGASLLVVLVFMILVSAVAIGLLRFTEVSFQASSELRELRQINYATDAATELGIQKVLADPTGELGTPDGPTCAFELQDINGGTSTVTCEPVGSAGEYNGNRPRNALLTLSETVDLRLEGNSPLNVDGHVYSRSGIVTSGPDNKLTTGWSVRAHRDGGDCDTDKVVALRGKNCTVSALTTAGQDPGWTPQAVTGPTNPRPGCLPIPPGPPRDAPDMTAVFEPGTYTTSPAALLGNGRAIDLLTELPVVGVDEAIVIDCSHVSTMYFRPGAYAFDGITFDLGERHVVAGTATSWMAGLATSPPTNESACQQDGAGAQFQLHGNATLVVPNESVLLSICAGPRTGDEPAIAIFGAGTNTAHVAVRAAKPGNGSNVTIPLSKPIVQISGTTYLPSSSMWLTMLNKSRTYYSNGVVAWSLVAHVNASTTQADAPISLPDCTESDPCRSNRNVIFRASSDAQEWVRSRVDIDDGYGATFPPAPTLRDWSVLR